MAAAWLQGQHSGGQTLPKGSGVGGTQPGLPCGGWVSGPFLGLWCRWQGSFCSLEKAKWVVERATAWELEGLRVAQPDP